MTLHDLDLTKIYTYADYLNWTLEERVELIRGRVFSMGPAPHTLHQQISGDIQGHLWTFLREKDCKVYAAPFDVRLPHESKADKEIVTVLQPDICVICNAAKLDERGCLGAPDIVIEILSPGNNSKELRNKYEVYEEAGVKEYWVVSPQNDSLIIYTLINSRYQPSRLLAAGDTVTSPLLPNFSLSLSELFEGVK